MVYTVGEMAKLLGIPITGNSQSISSFEAVLYPEINQLPCPESKTIESTANIAKTIHTIQSGPVAKSSNFYMHLLKFFITQAKALAVRKSVSLK